MQRVASELPRKIVFASLYRQEWLQFSHCFPELFWANEWTSTSETFKNWTRNFPCSSEVPGTVLKDTKSPCCKCAKFSLSVVQLQCCHSRDERHKAIMMQQQSNHGQNTFVSLSANVPQDVCWWCWDGLKGWKRRWRRWEGNKGNTLIWCMAESVGERIGEVKSLCHVV